jgi:hypothetical protein
VGVEHDGPAARALSRRSAEMPRSDRPVEPREAHDLLVGPRRRGVHVRRAVGADSVSRVVACADGRAAAGLAVPVSRPNGSAAPASSAVRRLIGAA